MTTLLKVVMMVGGVILLVAGALSLGIPFSLELSIIQLVLTAFLRVFVIFAGIILIILGAMYTE